MKNHIRGLLFLLFFHTSSWAQDTGIPDLIINEIQVANFDQYLDNANCYGGWIELYNPTTSSISLGNLYLVDGANEYQLLPAMGSVPAGGFKVLWFDHHYSQGSYGSGSRKQIPYKLDSEGGTINLLTLDGTIVSSASYPACIARCSWARTVDGGDEWQWTGDPTPGDSNSGSSFANLRLEEPTVSVDSQTFSEPFGVQVTIPQGYTLRYTLDGSAPTATNGDTSMDGRFDVSATTILRVCFLKEGYLPSPVVTRSYIYQNHDYYLPILSVVSEPKNFFDNKVGVFVKGTNGVSGNGQSDACNWNMDWERPVNMEYLVPEKNENGDIHYSLVLNQEMDLEICGGWTRAYGGATVDGRYWEARSSFRLKTDKKYEGVNAISYPVFPLKPYNKYRCWQVRNGGNDTYHRTKDPAIQLMVLRSRFYVDCQDYQPAHVFLNGEYYGMLNIRESNNKHFAYSNYGIDFDDMDQFDLSNAKYNQKMGDNEAWLQLQNLAKQLAQNKSEETYRQICDLLDIDEYANYMALECFIGPSDWITNTNNVKGFRSRTDGKFHFVLFDLDSAFSNSNMLNDVLNTSGGANVDDLFRNLMKYDPFRRQFMDAFCIVNGSVFEPSRCEEIVREIFENTNTALNFEGSSASTSLISTIYSVYNGSRITNMRSYFNPSFTIYTSISSNIPEARLAVNGQEIPTGKFEGYLYSYNGLPIQLTAKAPAGYVFCGWQSEGVTTSTTTLVPEGSEWMYFDLGPMDGFDWKALSFDASANGWRAGMAPFGFANSGYYMQENSVTKLDQGSGSKRSTYYFRNSFQIDAPLLDEDILTFYYQVDDGMMLYVNGHEVGGYYVASGSSYSDYTIGEHYEGQNPYQGSFVIPHEYLVIGQNLIAVEVKNCHANSSDIWFEGSLSLTRNERQTFEEANAIDLLETFENNSNAALKAVFVPITDEQQRWEAGASPLRINEVNPVGDICINDYGKRADWIELYNTTDQDISLEGLYLSDEPSNPQKYQLHGGIVPAHGTQIIWCDKKEAISQLHAPFKLMNADGAKVSIQAADGSWADCMEYLSLDKFQTFGRYPDGGNMATILNQPTINKSNKLGMSEFNLLTDDDWIGSDRTITIDLAEGWNWTSHNMAESVDKSRFLTDALQLRGQEESLLFNEEGWHGTLEALEAAKGYKIKMRQEGSVVLRGVPYDVNEPVALQAGWNWVGLPLCNATILSAALGGYAPSEGDKIVGLDAFATYEDGEWHGSLKVLQPGQAYLFYASREQEFCWQSLSPMRSRSKRYAPARRAGASLEDEEIVNSKWLNSKWLDGQYLHAFPDVMTLVARVEADEQVPLQEPYYVGAFCGDTCRGIGVWDGDLLYMNIHGEDPDQLVFRLLDCDGEVYHSAGYVVFQACRQLGTVQNPYPLWFANQDIIDEIKPSFTSSDKVKRTEYYNLAGQMVNSKWVNGKCVIRKVIYEDGTVTVSKLYR